MRLHVLSDLHLETAAPAWRPWWTRIPAGSGRRAGAGRRRAVPGAPRTRRSRCWGALRRKARHVIYVLGNHEHYHGALRRDGRPRRGCAPHGVTLLDQTTTGDRRAPVRRLHAVVRARRRGPPLRHALTDFRLIAGSRRGSTRRTRRARAFLERDHPARRHRRHPPRARARRGLAPHFGRSPTAPGPVLRERLRGNRWPAARPALWIHGHMHVPRRLAPRRHPRRLQPHRIPAGPRRRAPRLRRRRLTRCARFDARSKLRGHEAYVPPAPRARRLRAVLRRAPASTAARRRAPAARPSPRSPPPSARWPARPATSSSQRLQEAVDIGR